MVRFSCEKALVQQAVAAVSRAVAAKSSIPALEGLLLEGGDGLFVGNARGHIRLNLAMPRATVQIGLERIAEAIRKEKAGA